MAIGTRSASTTASGNGRTSTVVTAPAGAQTGDVIEVDLIVGASTSVTPTAPSGWTLVESTSSSAPDPYVVNLYKYVKAYDGAGSWTWTHASASTQARAICRTGVDTTTPQDVAASKAFQNDNVVSGVNTATAPSITTVTNGAVLSIARASWDGNAITAPAGFTETYDAPVLWEGEKTQATAGASGTVAVPAGNGSARSPWGIIMAALRPAGSGTNATVNAVPATVTATAAAPAVTATRSATVTGVAGTVTVQAVAPAVSAVRSPTVTAVAATVTAQATAPGVTGGATVTAVTATATVTAPAPAVTAVRNATITGVTATVTAQAITPVVSAGGSVTVQPPAAGATTAAVAPAVSTVRNPTTQATTATVTVQAHAPAVSSAGNATVTAPAGIVTAAAHAPSFTATGNVTATVATVSTLARAPQVIGTGGNAIARPQHARLELGIRRTLRLESR